MFILDTDVVSNFLDPDRSSIKLNDRIRNHSLDEIAITIITVEEMLRGALDTIRQAQKRRRNIVEAYDFFLRLEHDLQRFAILPYTADADRIYNSMTPTTRRLGGQDCRIAAIALAHDYVVVTANTQHFSKIPGVTTEDWTLG